ncbi:hypothetical protein, partial [Photobacterium indicum]
MKRYLFLLLVLIPFYSSAADIYVLTYPASLYCGSTGTKASLAECLNSGSYERANSKMVSWSQGSNVFSWKFSSSNDPNKWFAAKG